MMYALGARYLTLTHVRNTPWADSATDEAGVGGLSAFGREVVRECNRLGVMVDLSHVAPSTMHAALDTSTAPAFFSHSSARALCDHPRNVPDDVLARVRDTDGVVMVTFVPGFLNEECRAWMDALIGPRTRDHRRASRRTARSGQARRARRGRGQPAPAVRRSTTWPTTSSTSARWPGSDASGSAATSTASSSTPDGLTDVDGYPALLAELADRGWSDADLAKLTWHNALRVLRDTESAARAAQQVRGASVLTF